MKLIRDRDFWQALGCAVILVIVLSILAGCSSNPDAPSLLDRLEFGEDECGSFELTGDVNVGSPIPGLSTKLHVNLDKQKACTEG